MRKKYFILFFDHLLLALCFMLVVILRGQQPFAVMAQRHEWLLILLGIHFFTALIFDKYSFSGSTSTSKRLYRVLYANLAFASLVSLMFFLIGYLGMSRILFFGTLTLTTLLELVIAWTAGVFYTTRVRKDVADAVVDEGEALPQVSQPADRDPPRFLTIEGQAIKQSIVEEIGPNIFEYIKSTVPLGESSVILSVNNRLNILNLPSNCTETIVNLQRVNDHRYVNKFFEAVNFRLPPGGIYAGLAETKELRKKRFFRRYSNVLGFLFYCFDYLWNRLSPKLPVIRKLYFLVTKGRNRVMSRAEILGRLYSCGFIIVDERIVDDILFFVAKKIRMPYYDDNPTFGPLIKLSRLGKGGKRIGVYKMRTMHPYAEYLQSYVHKKNDLQKGGKFENDFRITTVGCLMRKMWIDELPMLVNWLKGDLKLVGVRPLSEHYFKLYSKELQEKRINHKPGLVPPFYADMPTTLDEIMASELKYLAAYEKHPFRTDWYYFWKAFVNIVFRKARSK